jgi:hypothetical protein
MWPETEPLEGAPGGHGRQAAGGRIILLGGEGGRGGGPTWNGVWMMASMGLGTGAEVSLPTLGAEMMLVLL